MYLNQNLIDKKYILSLEDPVFDVTTLMGINFLQPLQNN